jgi:hypothetical protein
MSNQYEVAKGTIGAIKLDKDHVGLCGKCKLHRVLWSGNLKGGEHLIDVGVEGDITVESI